MHNLSQKYFLIPGILYVEEITRKEIKYAYFILTQHGYENSQKAIRHIVCDNRYSANKLIDIKVLQVIFLDIV